MQAGIIDKVKPQWIILKGQTVGGLTVYCVDLFTPHDIILQAGITCNIKTTVDDIKNGQTVGGLTVYCINLFTTLYYTVEWHVKINV